MPIVNSPILEPLPTMLTPNQSLIHPETLRMQRLGHAILLSIKAANPETHIPKLNGTETICPFSSVITARSRYTDTLWVLVAIETQAGSGDEI